MRNKQHYLNMFDQNPTASVGYTLAAAAVYAARYGVCEPENHASEEWKQIARDLKGIYGESLTVDEVIFEIDGAITPDDLITQGQAAKVANISISAIGEAIKKRKLKSYKNPALPNARRGRPGALMVSESDVRRRWSKN